MFSKIVMFIQDNLHAYVNVTYEHFFYYAYKCIYVRAYLHTLTHKEQLTCTGGDVLEGADKTLTEGVAVEVSKSSIRKAPSCMLSKLSWSSCA